ncbi:2-C-methyl-D-erythritol 4-phosphate cytidylyltransferase [uncultured Sanguibacteroides sp.]|uniref:2-C-methyl-D-erythritol 4-phosphate cytidylyltransferase n=1 Tax=uncultured Sanguibacteroides sp. TaxID=1635151 RepID=UPI0025F0BCDF|nr:2-C-methyl-D-erythritol 4-phosphate cytidylyltransferase [uncultured Sanguibacteroides sp.]
MKRIGVILAGGSGLRMGNDIPKQFLKIAGKSVLAHTLSVFQTHPGIDEIIIVIHKDFIAQAQHIVDTEGIHKVKKIVPGGKERYHSTLAALGSYTDENVLFIIHDAVRLLVSHSIIHRIIESLHTYKACTTAIPATDTIVQSDSTGQFIAAIPQRQTLFHVQTPQGFHSTTLREAYRLAQNDPHFTSTDDCGVVRRYFPDIPIKIVEGSPANVKLTYKEDIPVIEKLLLARNNTDCEDYIDF